MQIFSKIYEGVSEFYKEINPSTLSGAVDIVVVEDVQTGRLSCSPFHVRFGKLQVMRPSEKKVEIEVNGRVVEGVSMKIGLAGETFFVLPVEGPVPSEYQTSPLPVPLPGSPDAVPRLTLSPTKQSSSDLLVSPVKRATAVSDSELDAPHRPARYSNNGALSDGEIGPAAAEKRGGGEEDEWTWKWGDLPTKEDDEQPDPSAVAALEDEILNQEDTTVDTTVVVGEWLERRDTIKAMYERLQTVVIGDDGLEAIELCLFKVVDTLNLPPSALTSYPVLTTHIPALTWSSFSTHHDISDDMYVCIYAPSGDCAVFKAQRALKMLLGLRIYKQLLPLPSLCLYGDDGEGVVGTQLDKTTAVSKVEDSSIDKLSHVDEKGESILSWRQWWGSPRSQSAKIVPPPSNELLSTLEPSSSSRDPVASSIPTPVASSIPTPVASSVPTPPISYAKSLRLPSADLQKLSLLPGSNTITFTALTSKNGRATCTARIFLWRSDDKIVISDIDGTITKSDALGHLFQFVGKDWTHLGVANLYTDIARNGYRFLYLTSRPIGQANQTRGYLRGIEQNRYQLPEGPVIMSPDRFFTAVRREVIEGNPEQFKIPCLLDIRRLFTSATGTTMALSEDERATPSPFYAGFGNRPTDALSYRSVGINPARIYIINPAGDLSLQIITGYRSSYIKLVDLVDNVFPPLNTAMARDQHDLLKVVVGDAGGGVGDDDGAEEEYGDFMYWKQAVNILDPSTISLLTSPSDILLSDESPQTAEQPSPPHPHHPPLLPPRPSPDEPSHHPTPPDHEDDDTSERGDRYYFEEKDEAGLIPFA